MASQPFRQEKKEHPGTDIERSLCRATRSQRLYPSEKKRLGENIKTWGEEKVSMFLSWLQKKNHDKNTRLKLGYKTAVQWALEKMEDESWFSKVFLTKEEKANDTAKGTPVFYNIQSEDTGDGRD